MSHLTQISFFVPSSTLKWAKANYTLTYTDTLL